MALAVNEMKRPVHTEVVDGVTFGMFGTAVTATFLELAVVAVQAYEFLTHTGLLTPGVTSAEDVAIENVLVPVVLYPLVPLSILYWQLFWQAGEVEAVILAVTPAHTVAEESVGVGGIGFIVIDLVPVTVHPEAFLAVTVAPGLVALVLLVFV